MAEQINNSDLTASDNNSTTSLSPTTLTVPPTQQIPTLPPSLIATERVHLHFSTSTSPITDFPSRLRSPRYGQIAQRRVDSKDASRAHAAARDCSSWRRNNRIEEEVAWGKIEWTREHHPGVLVEGDVKEEEEWAPEEVPFWVRWRVSGRRGTLGRGKSVGSGKGEVSPRMLEGRMRARGRLWRRFLVWFGCR